MIPHYKTIMKRTSTYIATIPMKNVEQVIEVKKTLEQIFGWVVLRGRHSDRKKVLGDNWRCSKQNDIPWRKAQRIDIYLHPQNPNYKSAGQGKGIQRKNLNTFSVGAAALGLQGLGFYDQHLKQLEEKALRSAKAHRKLMKEKYQNKSYKLQPGDWGFIAQSILDFTEKHGRVTFSELKEYYDVILRGKPKMENGGSFIHHLQSLVSPANAKGRRCKRYLYKGNKKILNSKSEII
jgi:hypothetical protein